MKKILTLILVLAAVLSVSGIALADEVVTLDIANGSIEITADGYTQGTGSKETYSGDYVITQTGADTATANTITVNGIADGKTITLNGINIESSTAGISPIKANATVTIQLLGENKIKYTAAQNSALHIAKDTMVTLCVPAGMQDSAGSLTAEVTNRYTSAIGAGDRGVAGYLVVNSGTITAKRSGSTSGEGTSIGAIRPNGIHIMQGITINGGIVNATSVNGNAMGLDSKTDNIAPITITGGYVYSNNGFSSNLTVTGGNVKTDAGKEPAVSGKTMTKLYVVDANGTARANDKVTINSWDTYTDDNGIITTYLAESDTIMCGTETCNKLPGGWIIGGTCVCDTAPLTFADTTDEVDVYSASVEVDVTVRGECAMPIHKDVTVTCVIDSVTLEEGTTVTASEYAAYDAETKKLTLKPADDNYSVKLRAQRTVADTPAYHEIKVCASNTVGRKLNIANGPITVTAASEAGKVTYTQGGNTFTVSEDTPVTITGTSSENNIEISTDATIVLRDLTLTDITAKSPIKITKNATLNLWLEGENTLTTGTYNHNDGDIVNGVTTAAIFVESGSTLIIDSEAGTLTNDDIDAAHYGDKQKGYAGSLLAKNTGTRGGASAIGGDYFADPNMACGNITIKGGNVTAQATLASSKFFSGAAIGSGYTGADGSVVPDAMCGDITITGGNIRALAAEGNTTPGRAISSGVGDLTITGGVIYASAPNDGWNGDSAGSIYSHNGTLTIGEANGNDSDLYIYAGTTTKNVTGTDNAAPAIGVSSGGTLNILSGTITAESTGNGPAIGVAAYAPVKDEPVELNIKGGTIKLTLADETQAGTPAAIGIGGNNHGNKIEINISGGSIESDKLNIGVRGNQDSKVNISGDAKVTVNNGNLVGDLNTSGTSYTTIGGNASGNVTVGIGSAVNVTKDIKGDVTVEKNAGFSAGKVEGDMTVGEGASVNVGEVDGTVSVAPGATYNGRYEAYPYSGPSIWYIGGNTFGTSTTRMPTSVEIDYVSVPFTMEGSNIVVSCINPGARWATVKWNSTSATINFNPDANVVCAQVVIPKTGDMPIWAAIAEFLGF